MSDRKPTVDAALDLLVYAPLGFALEARSLLPKMVERGRNQVTMAKVMGQFAVQQGQAEASKRLGPVQEQVKDQVGGVLVDLGLVARPESAAPPAAPSDAPPSSPPPPRVVAVDDEPDGDDTPAEPVDLAIPDYDSLAASQVVPRLRALSPAELEEVRVYEAAGRGRKTILNRIAQLQSD